MVDPVASIQPVSEAEVREDAAIFENSTDAGSGCSMEAVAAPARLNVATQLLNQIGLVMGDKSSTTQERTARIARSMRRAGIVAGATAALYWLLLSPPIAMSTLYNSALFHPSRQIPHLAHINSKYLIEDVTFKSAQGATLHGWYIHNPAGKKTVLFSHGNGGNIASFEPTLYACLLAGASVLAYDYQGYGESEGKPTLDGIVADGEGAYDYLVKEKGVDPKNIVLFGQSLGTGVSAQLSVRRKAAALILMSPFTSIINVGRQHLAWLNLYPDFSFPKQILNTREVLSQAHPPTLIIHGEQDMTVPFAHSKQLLETSAQPLEFIPVAKAGHSDILSIAPEKVIDTLKKYLN